MKDITVTEELLNKINLPEDILKVISSAINRAEQRMLLEEVAEDCLLSPNEQVYAIFSYAHFSTESTDYSFHYVSDYVFKNLESEDEFLRSFAPYFDSYELEEAEEEYQKILKYHQKGLDYLKGKEYTEVSIERLLEILKFQIETLDLSYLIA